MNEIIIICMAAGVLIGIAVIIFSIISQKKGVKKSPASKIMLNIYRFLQVFFLTKRLTERITIRVAKLSVFRQDKIPSEVVKIIFLGAVWALALVAAGIFMFSDFVTKFLCFVFAAVLFSNVIDKKIDKVNQKVLRQTKVTLS